MINGQNIFYQSLKNSLITYDNFWKIRPKDANTTRCLLDYPYFKNYYKKIVIDSIKQQTLDVDPKSIQQINITGTIDRQGNPTRFFSIEEANKTIFIFHKELWKYWNFNLF